MRRFDTRKLRKLTAREQYGELYFLWREAEQMIASDVPEGRRYGRRLKRRIETLYADWFGPAHQWAGVGQSRVWAAG
jgi:hypothetical protein